VTLLPGHRYAFGGSFKNALGSAPSTWLEYGVMKEQPKGGEIATGEFSYVYNLNTWMGADTLNVDTTFEEYFPLSGGENGIIAIPDTVADTEWFIVIKTGCWGATEFDPDTKFDFLFDDIALYDVSVVNTGGNMEDASAWKFYYNVADAHNVDGTTEFGYTANTPAAGEGGCYRVSTYGQSATFTYQAVDVIPGHRYQLTGAFKNALESAPSTWLEFGVMREEPGGGEVATSEFSFVYNLNTWMGADTLNVDTTFEDYFPFSGQKDGIFLVPDTVTDTQWYILIKTGCWGATEFDPDTKFDFLFDEIYLVDLGLEPWITLPVSKVVVGTVDSGDDFTGSVRMKYDADSVYMIFNVVDDVIVNTGTSYQVDNIEVYFDMDNSKNAHYPRNGGWVASIDAAYDANDYQLRLVPDVAFSTNNSARPASASIAGGYNQIYTQTDNGYQFILNIAWETLMPGFVAEGGALIGFDVLWSDNDVSASDANRNQITWNSPTDKPFNDPSLFGVLQLTPNGSFVALTDTEKPTAPTNLVAVADGSSITLTWDASTDNRVVHQYIISDKTAVIDTIYAKASGNSYTLKNLENGSHRPGVVAMDVYGNKSAKVQTENITIAVSADLLAEAGYRVYPNPTNGMVRISSNSRSAVQLSVYNLTGERVHNELFTESCLLNLSQHKKGMYLLYLTTEGNTTISKLMIK
ncbi:MAG TPA: sugar-binding protein, partial [Prolixibacteraceae bacterium]|nr:sugar-binding protein [Prolixibacteraceae bacterium]